MRSTILPELTDHPVMCSVFSKPCSKQQQRTATSPNLAPNPPASRETVPMPVVLRVFQAGHNRAADTADIQIGFDLLFASR